MRSLQEADAIVTGLVWPFIILAIVAFCLLAVFGWWFTRRTFAPIEDITETAYRIGVNGDLKERIKTNPHSNDEISRLGRAFNAMLERLDKNFKAQKQFIADSSHELRTPLTVIRGNVDLLKRNPDPENQTESLQAIERESARMQRLVQDLLLLAQADARQTVEMAPLPLDDIVAGSLQGNPGPGRPAPPAVETRPFRPGSNRGRPGPPQTGHFKPGG